MRQPPPCDAEGASWCSRVPPVARLTVYCVVLLGLLSLLTDSSSYLLNYPSKSALQYQVWRLTTSSFLCSSWFSGVFMVLFHLLSAPECERQTGSMRRFVYFLTNCLAIQVMYVVGVIGLGLIYGFSEYESYSCSGLWGVIVLDNILRAVRSPNSELKFLCVPFYFRVKFLPILLLVAFHLCHIGASPYLGLLLSLLHYKGFGTCFLLTDTAIAALERVPVLQRLQGMQGYISLQRATGDGSMLYAQFFPTHWSQFEPSAPPLTEICETKN